MRKTAYLGSMIMNDARCTREINTRIDMKKAAFNKQKALFSSKMDFNLKKKLIQCYIWSIALCGVVIWTVIQCYIWSIALCGAVIWTLWTVNREYLESLEMEGEDQLNYRVRNAVLHRVDGGWYIVCICCILGCLVCIVVSCVYCCSCLVCIVVSCVYCCSCLVCIVVSCLVCIVVVVLCVLL